MKSLKESRIESNMTQTDVAVAIGCSLSSVRLWEMGVTTPSPENQIKLDKLFGENKGG